MIAKLIGRLVARWRRRGPDVQVEVRQQRPEPDPSDDPFAAEIDALDALERGKLDVVQVYRDAGEI